MTPKATSPTRPSSILLLRQTSQTFPPRESHASFRVTAPLGWGIPSSVQPLSLPNVTAEVLGPVFTVRCPRDMLWLQAQGGAGTCGQHPKSSKCFGALRVDKGVGVGRVLAKHLPASFLVHHLPDTTSSFSSPSLCCGSCRLPWRWPWKQSEVAGKLWPVRQQTWVQVQLILCQ